jgi:hypothetical protein
MYNRPTVLAQGVFYGLMIDIVLWHRVASSSSQSRIIRARAVHHTHRGYLHISSSSGRNPSCIAFLPLATPCAHDTYASCMLILDVHFIHTLPVLAAARPSRASGNPEGKSHRDWMPACAGMTFYWRRTYETDI